jgi:hypothetical protein
MSKVSSAVWLSLATICILGACAQNGEFGLANHPLDCAQVIVHSDYLPGTLGYAPLVGPAGGTPQNPPSLTQDQTGTEEPRRD